MEGISTITHTIREGDWLSKLDLKDAYFTVPIFPIIVILSVSNGGVIFLNLCLFLLG